MALIPGCDIYPGRTKDVRQYRITIAEKLKDGTCIEPLFTADRFACPAALKRIMGFCNRGTQPPTKAKVDENRIR